MPEFRCRPPWAWGEQHTVPSGLPVVCETGLNQVSLLYTGVGGVSAVVCGRRLSVRPFPSHPFLGSDETSFS